MFLTSDGTIDLYSLRPMTITSPSHHLSHQTHSVSSRLHSCQLAPCEPSARHLHGGTSTRLYPYPHVDVCAVRPQRRCGTHLHLRLHIPSAGQFLHLAMSHSSKHPNFLISCTLHESWMVPQMMTWLWLHDVEAIMFCSNIISSVPMHRPQGHESSSCA